VVYEGQPAIQATVTDITDRKRLEEEIKRHRENLQRLMITRNQEIQLMDDRINHYTHPVEKPASKSSLELSSMSPPRRQPWVPIRAICFDKYEVMSGIEATAINWRTHKAKELFAYLIQHQGNPVPSEKLMEEFWPDLDPERAAGLLYTNLYHIRRIMKECGIEKGIIHTGGAYRLVLGSVISDAGEFERLLIQAETGADEARILEEAVALYQGDYLMGIEASWAASERERLTVLYHIAMKRLVRRLLEENQYEKAILFLNSLWRRNPLLEEVHVLLMKAYAAAGDRQKVIVQYEVLKESLRMELGVEPAAETRRLFYELCGG
jgi:two-component SAPR family response regulator